MRLGVWLTRRQIRVLIKVVGDHTKGGDLSDEDRARLVEAFDILRQVEVDDPPPKHGKKCPECGHVLSGHRYIPAIGHVTCQINSCRCGARPKRWEDRRTP